MLKFKADYAKQGADEYTNFMHTTPHTVEIIQIISGNGTIQVGNSIYPMNPGDLYIINMDTMHCTTPISVDSYVRNKIFIGKFFLLELLRLADFSDGFDEMFFGISGVHVSLTHENSKYFDLLCKELSRGDEASFFNNLSLLFKVLHFCVKGEEKSSENIYVSKAIDYIKNHISESLSIDDIAINCYISKYYLCHIFKKCTGDTIGNYIKNYRLKIAKKKLICTSEKISEIAMSCGYSCFSSFSTQFKALTGYSPSTFRGCFLNLYH